MGRRRGRLTVRRMSPEARAPEPMTLSQRYDVVALGELVIDLVPARTAEGAPCFVPKPGGAPGNVAVGVARLGGRAAMLSKVGEEAFGRLLIDTLRGYGVATNGVLTTREGATSLAFVAVAPDGERDFMLYRHGCADFDLSSRGRGRGRDPGSPRAACRQPDPRPARPPPPRNGGRSGSPGRPARWFRSMSICALPCGRIRTGCAPRRRRRPRAPTS